jgi:lipoprotein-anchoring transpeptidase ErfK/SrfK
MPAPKHLHPRSRASILGLVSLGFALAAMIAVAVVAVNSNDVRSPERPAATGTQPPTVTSTPLAPTPKLPSGTTYIARAAVAQVAVYDSPQATTAKKHFANPWYINNDPKTAVPLVFHVEEVRTDGWLHVLLPVRPNSSTGWIRTSEVTLSTTQYRITVALGAHRLTVYRGAQVLVTDTVAVGTHQTPTPLGNFYIRALLKAPDPNTAYGPFAYGLSGYSEVLEQFAGGDAEVGIHGNNDPSVLGKNVSHGCVRMSNATITMLTKLLPLGTPVAIVR